MIKEIDVIEASELDIRISIHWWIGRVMVLKICGFDRVAMIHRYELHESGVEIRFLMIDTLIGELSGSRAWGLFNAGSVVRAAESWDAISIQKLMFPKVNRVKI